MKKAVLRVLGVGMALTMLFTAFTACGNQENSDNTASNSSVAAETTSPGTTKKVYDENGLSKEEEVTLKMAFFEGGNGREYIDELVAAFSKKFPNVKFELAGSPKIADIINAKISAGDNNDMYDLFYPGGAVKIQDLINAGKLEAFDILDREPYDKPGKKLRDVIPSPTYETMPLDEKGNPYAINTAAAMRGVFFDKVFFKQNGWNDNPKTWSEFLALCEKIKASGVSPIISFRDYLGYLTAPKVLEVANMIGDTEIQKNFTEFGVPYYSSKAFVELHKRLAELGSKGYFDNGTGAVSHTESQMMIIQHKAALVPTGTWVENEMKDATPAGFEWGFMTIPFRDKEEQTMYSDFSANNSSFYIWKEKPELNKRWAKEFKLFMLSLEGQQIIAKSGQIPIRDEYTEDQKLIESLQPMAKVTLDYYEKNKVELFNITYHTHSINDPNFSQWSKLYAESLPGIVNGDTKDIEAKLREIDSYLEKAQPAKVKIR